MLEHCLVEKQVLGTADQHRIPLDDTPNSKYSSRALDADGTLSEEQPRTPASVSDSDTCKAARVASSDSADISDLMRVDL